MVHIWGSQFFENHVDCRVSVLQSMYRNRDKELPNFFLKLHVHSYDVHIVTFFGFFKPTVQ